MRTLVILRPFLFCALLGISSPGCTDEPSDTAAGQSDTFFTVSGDVTVSIDEATATLVRIRGKYPAMTIVSAPSSIKKLGKSYSANLFFSNDFEPKPGTYPIAFSYRVHPNTLGGSFLQRGAMFSHDTVGTAEFIEFGDEVKVRFEFEVFDQSEGTEGRQSVTVKGEAVAQHADIF